MAQSVPLGLVAPVIVKLAADVVRAAPPLFIALNVLAVLPLVAQLAVPVPEVNVALDTEKPDGVVQVAPERGLSLQKSMFMLCVPVVAGVILTSILSDALI